MNSKRIAVFASGNGSNAEEIIKYFNGTEIGKVDLVLSNNAHAYVLQRAAKYGIPAVIFDKKELHHTGSVLKKLQEHNIDFIVLAGFMWLMPKSILSAYPDRIVNIHPALLPKYGGKGMYGMRVHEAVQDAEEKETGITIHYVNERYDEGGIIFQARCAVDPGDTPEEIARKVHQLEYTHYPQVIETVMEKQFQQIH